jgi:hypothetical protein
VERDVARDRAVAARDRRRIVRHELAAFGIESKDEDAVEPFVGNDDEPAGEIEDRLVRVRPVLVLAPRAVAAFSHVEIAARPERAVVVPRKDRDSRPIAQHDPAVRRIDSHRRRVVSAGFPLVEECEPAGAGIDRVSADLSAVAVRGIEEALRRVEAHVMRIRNRVARVHERPLAVGVDAVDRDAFPPRLAFLGGEAADVGKFHLVLESPIAS